MTWEFGVNNVFLKNKSHDSRGRYHQFLCGSETIIFFLEGHHFDRNGDLAQQK